MRPEELDALDYYALLGVARTAGRDDVRRAFHAFARAFHPDRHTGADDVQRARVEATYRRGAEAYRILSDPELRARYDAGLARGQRRYDPDAVQPAHSMAPRGPLVVRSPKARPFAAKAEDALKRGDWQGARLNLKIALQHEPGHPGLEQRLTEVEAKLAKPGAKG